MPSVRFPDLIALRGNVTEYPENTLPALSSALDLGARHIELEVQLSADREPILLGDSSLQRTAGIERSALEMTWRELSEVVLLDVARSAQRRKDVGIATLRQAASLLATFPSATAFVEIKRASLRAFGPEVVVRRVCEALKPVVRQCVIVSFDLAAVHHVRQITSYRIGWRLAEYTNLSALKCEALVPDYMFCDQQLLTQGSSALWRGPWRWAIYDITTRKAALEVAARGARLAGTSAIRSMLREAREMTRK